jgi:putative hydrolase of the HAD superfamily
MNLTTNPDPHSTEAVLLDAGGVLVLPDPVAARRLLEPYGAEPDDDTVFRAHYAGMREVDRMGRPDWHAVDRVVAAVAGVAPEQIEEALSAIERLYRDEPWVPVEGAAASMLALEATGLRLAVVSNATGTMEKMLLEHRICGVEGIENEAMAKVAVIIDSHVVGVEKPDPRIFDLALDEVGVPADRCCFVGDSVHFDVQGARGAGLLPVHVDPYGFCPDADHDHVTGLADVVAAFAGFGGHHRAGSPGPGGRPVRTLDSVPHDE